MALLDRLLRPDTDDSISTYTYEAVSTAGERVKSTMTASSETAVSAALQANGWLPVSITRQTGGVNIDIGQLWESRPLKFDVDQQSEFARQLYQLLDAGISAPRAVSSIGSEAEPRVKGACDDITSKMTAGVPMSEALGHYPKAFPDVFRAVVKSGETAGTLEETVKRLSAMLQKAAEMRNKIKGVTSYPKAVGIAIGLVVFGILKFMVPTYAGIYDSFGAELPAATQFVVDLSNRLPIAILGIVATFLGFREFVKRRGDSPELAREIDRIRFKMPVFGKLNHRRTLFAWAQTLSGSLAAGVNTYEALKLAADASGSRWLKMHLPTLASAVREGRRMTDEMKLHPDLYPANIRTMISVGEETGDVPDMLDSVTRALDSDIDRIVATLGAKIEVLLLLVLGVVVGGLLAVLYLPILNLANTVMEGLGG